MITESPPLWGAMVVGLLTAALLDFVGADDTSWHYWAAFVIVIVFYLVVFNWGFRRGAGRERRGNEGA